MLQEQINHFFDRIDNLTEEHPARFGKMSAHQMIVHCADQLRMAIDIRKPLAYGDFDGNKAIELAMSKKTVPAPKGLGQVEGEGTSLTSFLNDKEILKNLIITFNGLPEDFDYPPHPYFGDYSRDQWNELVVYHLNHHFRQFGI